MTPSDQRLLTEMETALRSFDAERITFRALLDRLESCLDNFSDEDLPWKEAFQHKWGILEDTYAYASDMGQKTIPESDMSAVEAALAELKRLVAEKTGENDGPQIRVRRLARNLRGEHAKEGIFLFEPLVTH